MTVEEALERINRVETSLLLKERPNTETLSLMLDLLRELGSAPGSLDVIQGKLLSLTKWIDLLSNKYETYGGTDTIKGIILAESRTLKYIICHASDSLES